jgi:transposase
VSLSQCCPCVSCLPAEAARLLLPWLSEAVIEGCARAGGRVWLRVRPAAAEAACTGCGALSARVHGGYLRRLRDVPAGGQDVVIVLAARRFRCGNPDCGKATFTEQVPGLSARFARRTPPARAALTAAAVALCGRAGARLAAALGMEPPSRHTMIRLVMALPEEEPATPEVLGVDDFALRRGRAYGTVLIDVETGRVIDLLADREAATLAEWLKAHPGTAVVCRDRAGAYAEAAREGAPGAVQVADRWHLLHNLCEHVRNAAARHRDLLGEPPQGIPADPGPVIRERHAAVHALRAAGHDLPATAAALGISRQLTARLWRAPDADALLAPALAVRGLDPFKPWLRAQLERGRTNISRLHAQLTARGYTGSYATTYRYASLFTLAAPPPPPAPPAPARVAGWIMTRPGTLDPRDAATLAAILARCPDLAALAAHAATFAEILTGRLGQARLDDWLAAAEADPAQPELRSFTAGIRRDYQAVASGLTLTWSSGKVEGTVNKIKTIKRQMYGRASLPLLRKRLLLA